MFFELDVRLVPVTPYIIRARSGSRRRGVSFIKGSWSAEHIIPSSSVKGFLRGSCRVGLLMCGYPDARIDGLLERVFGGVSRKGSIRLIMRTPSVQVEEMKEGFTLDLSSTSGGGVLVEVSRTPVVFKVLIQEDVAPVLFFGFKAIDDGLARFGGFKSRGLGLMRVEARLGGINPGFSSERYLTFRKLIEEMSSLDFPTLCRTLSSNAILGSPASTK
ncbi:hypothetical protein B9Q04_04720 [Candidatus Marsarchaeota G2 archaeon BE_D]|uniref:CRISPR-associated RAMP protein n=4 Tax=Candidatus Marsarchaeota group 2 TaxID=2203771 RepID=A0A2R6CCJ6_9ARCH|nr:MAG: hypothetical protein B9Q06_05815 [Candidatus Marsarchaeota G2 archaeon ECH_B_2]PSN98297.1 MAG: hypothetical protein B9Q07_10145 [Candidatus Marsarchaeota G2 archaeon ECH_B_3]PSO00007.1 MAG: hypothetical protein B9Q05_11025 [Candidatus Marsarchaeota G2 archaeon ECH_B_1]PSO08608.1 MAG: hypothetical protein B9Q04_04720 [Candidatus Marsarchaeota G2 archaeon BE_D]